MNKLIRCIWGHRKDVTIRDIRKAILSTKLIYPDVIQKELVRFNEVFKDIYLMETKQILKDEVWKKYYIT